MTDDIIYDGEVVFPKGKAFKFYGVDDYFIKVDKMIVEVIEDECDGYRSMHRGFRVTPSLGSKLIFFKKFIDTVTIIDPGTPSDYSDFNGYQLVSTVDGHVWLTFGTDNDDDYYPGFIFNYTPRVAELSKT